MTPDEWDACTEPQRMLQFLRESGGVSDRKLRLFAVASFRRGGWSDAHPAIRDMLGVAERFADGAAGDKERGAACAALAPLMRRAANPEPLPYAAAGAAHLGARKGQAAARAAWHAANLLRARVGRAGGDWAGAARVEEAAQAAILRDVVGPFRPVILDPSWLTPAVLSLALASYDERILPLGHLDPLRLAVLADALEELGGADDAVGHLRSEGPHVRGCHVVDLVLGRE